MRHGVIERTTEYSIPWYKLTILLITVFVLVGCASKPQNQSEKSFSSTELKYSAYNWYVNENTDTFDFYLAHYIAIDSNGHFVLMRHKTDENKPLYFSGYLTDTIRKQIDTILQNRTYHSDYTWEVNSGFIYDGYTYTIDYKNNNSERKIIQFIPNNSPLPIRILAKMLDSIIYKTDSNKLDTLFIDDYSIELNKSYINRPFPKVKPSVKFTPPDITK
jgi:hypothetical protein